MNDGDDKLDLPQVTDPSYTAPPQLTGGGILGDPMQSMQQQSGQALISQIQVPEEANELDLIEKEWVLKAKQIVEHTYDDPHVQQAEISKMKADYMKKRYDKDIKIAESS